MNGNGDFDAFFSGASGDGSRVFLSTSERLVSADTDDFLDVYERSGGATTQVSQGEVNGNDALHAFFAGASADGSKVLFTTDEPLVSGDTDSSPDVYERSGGTTTQVSQGQVNGNGAFEAAFAGASADGSKVFFTYRRAAGGRRHRQLARRLRALRGHDDPGLPGPGERQRRLRGRLRRRLRDGSKVFFSTDEPLVGGDTDSSPDVYERSGGATTQVSQGEVNGNGAFEAAFAGASGDGSRVFF